MNEKPFDPTKPAQTRDGRKARILATVSAPIDARTENQICNLKRNNIDTPDYWLNVSPHDVCITKQRVGEQPSESMNIPRKDFNRLARWYVTGAVR